MVPDLSIFIKNQPRRQVKLACTAATQAAAIGIPGATIVQWFFVGKTTGGDLCMYVKYFTLAKKGGPHRTFYIQVVRSKTYQNIHDFF